MAQAGFTPILIYASSTPGALPSAGDLTSSASGAELAINYADGKLYFKNSSGVVTLLAGSSSGPAGGSNTQVQYNSSGVLAGSSNLTFDGTSLTLGGNPTLSAGTANGVLYLNGSKVATSGSALTFDGTEFKVNAASGNVLVQPSNVANAKLYMRHGSIGNNNGFEVDVSSNTIFLQAGSEAMRLTSTGLGIGTSSPGYKLDVRVAPASGGAAGAGVTTGSYEGTILITGSAYNNYGVGANTAWLYSATNDVAIGPYGGSGTVQIVTGGARRATLDPSGNLGLGVTPSAWASQPAIQQTGGALWGVNAANYEVLQNAFYNGTNYIYCNTNLASRYNQNAGVHSWFTAPSGTAGNAITFTQAMTLDASGRLGVGATTINAQMVIGGVGGYSVGGNRNTLQLRNSNSSGNQSNFFVFGSAGTESSCWIGNDLAANGTEVNVLSFATNNTERMRIDASGNLGLGVTPSAWGGSYKALQTGAGSFANYNNASLAITQNAYDSGAGAWTYIASNAASFYQQTGGVHYWYTAPSGTAGNAITFTQAMTLDASGNLGVGTTSPAYRIDAEYNANATNFIRVGNSNSGTSSKTALYMQSDSATGQFGTVSSGWTADPAIPANHTYAYGSNGLTLYAGASAYMAFLTNATERARITSGGDLLVGTTSGAITVNGLKFLSDGSFYAVQNSGVTSSIYNKSNYTSGTDFFADFRLANTTVGSISANGSTTSYTTSSDRRLKENIAPAADAGPIIDAIEVVQHDWKAGGHTRYGMIAQELNAVAPEAVTAGDDGDEIERTWGVDYSKLVPMLVKEIQSLRQRVALLEGN